MNELDERAIRKVSSDYYQLIKELNEKITGLKDKYTQSYELSNPYVQQFLNNLEEMSNNLRKNQIDLEIRLLSENK